MAQAKAAAKPRPSARVHEVQGEVDPIEAIFRSKRSGRIEITDKDVRLLEELGHNPPIPELIRPMRRSRE